MARISPVVGLVTRAAPLLIFSRPSFLISADNEAWAYSWRARSREVVTRKPPRLTKSSPYLSTRKSLTQRAKWGALISILLVAKFNFSSLAAAACFWLI